jgi:transcriptional regulator with XRE-family HTH domain
MKNSKINLIEEIQIEILNVELAKRKKENSNYSLRKFAEDAGIDNSTMSKYLKSNRKMTDYIFTNILRSLKVSEGVEADYKREVLKLDLLEKKHSEIRANWYYYAILELTVLSSFKSDPEYISKKLDLDLETTKNAIALLMEVGALVEENGKYIDNLGNVTFIEHIDMDIEEGRIHQTQLLEKSIYSVNNNNSNIKDHTSYSFALDSKLIPEVKKLIEVNLTALTKPD